jgi:hypothetical protein
MSSRSQDAATLAELATHVATHASHLEKTATILSRFNEVLTILEQQNVELNEANDDLDRRLAVLERG